jgi:hypothetical protein
MREFEPHCQQLFWGLFVFVIPIPPPPPPILWRSQTRDPTLITPLPNRVIVDKAEAPQNPHRYNNITPATAGATTPEQNAFRHPNVSTRRQSRNKSYPT